MNLIAELLIAGIAIAAWFLTPGGTGNDELILPPEDWDDDYTR